MSDMTRLQVFTVGAIFGWIAFAIVLALLPGGEFQEAVGRFSQILAAYVLLLGAALAYRAAMARIEHDKADIEFRRQVLGKSLNREYDARIGMIAGRIAYIGIEARSRKTLKRNAFKRAIQHLEPARDRLSELLVRIWENLDKVSHDDTPDLTERAIRGEAVVRNMTLAIEYCKTELAAFDATPTRQPQAPNQLLAFAITLLSPARRADPKLGELIDRRIKETRDIYRPVDQDYSVFDLPKESAG